MFHNPPLHGLPVETEESRPQQFEEYGPDQEL
jgi:hypothetical protein